MNRKISCPHCSKGIFVGIRQRIFNRQKAIQCPSCGEHSTLSLLISTYLWRSTIGAVALCGCIISFSVTPLLEVMFMVMAFALGGLNTAFTTGLKKSVVKNKENMRERLARINNTHPFHTTWIIFNSYLIYHVLFIRGLDNENFILIFLLLASILCSFRTFWKFIFRLNKGTSAMAFFSSSSLLVISLIKLFASEEILFFFLKTIFGKGTYIVVFILLISIIYSLSILWNSIFKKGKLTGLAYSLSFFIVFFLSLFPFSLIFMRYYILSIELKNTKSVIVKTIDLNEIKQLYDELNEQQKHLKAIKDYGRFEEMEKSYREALNKQIVFAKNKMSKISLCLSGNGRHKKECAEIRKKNYNKKNTLTRKMGSH